MGPLVEKWIMRSRSALRIRMGFYGMALSLLTDKSGLEIGGPSDTFRRGKSLLPVYSTIRSLDNCDISSSTVWASHSEEFFFDEEKPPGKNIFCDASNLSSIADRTYDFVLSCHNLEHFANPVKALKEWQRVMVKRGIFVIVLPYYRYTFDHRRNPTAVSHMIADFENDTPETDLSHLPEILERHDLSLDIAAGTPEEFRQRSLANYENRCLHHHVFDTRNIRDLLATLGIRVLSLQTVWANHIFVVAESR
jgi:SAM-dependent methyltransferase